MADVAALNIKVNTDDVKQANAQLKEMVPAASAAERAAKKWGLTTDSAARSAEDFSKRVRKTIADLEFERQQLTRTAAEKMRYAILRRAGVSEASAEGRAILNSVAALQAQKAALAANGKQATSMTAAFGSMRGAMGPLIAALSAAALAHKAWSSVMAIGDLGEQAEQLAISTDQLQAYRLAANQAGISNETLDAAILKLGRAMGEAASGNDELIASFDKIGVKLLDAQRNLRAPTDVLPELAKGLLNVNNTGEQTKLMMDLLGRAGPRLRTVLADWATGNAAVIKSAKDMGAVASPATIAAWDALGDKIKITGNQWAVFIAEAAKPVVIPVFDMMIKGLTAIMGLMKAIAALANMGSSAAGGADLRTKLGELDEKLANLNRGGGGAAARGLIQAQRNEVAGLLETQRQIEREANTARAPGGMQPAAAAASTAGVSQPLGDKAKKAGESAGEAYRKIAEGAREYIETKKAEMAALGQTAEVAARMKHEQELLNKAQGEGKTVTREQRAELMGLAADMAKADAALAGAKFMDDLKTKAEEFIATQEIERATLYMSTEAAMAYRLEQEAINAAKSQGISLGPQAVDQIRQLAAAQSAAAEQTRVAREMVDLEKEAVKGFFTDLTHGLREGKSAADSFGEAMMNMLNKISDKLLDMAVNQLFEQAFGGQKGGGGGFLQSIFGSLFGGSGGGLPSGASLANVPGGFASGGAFRHGNVVPFARGGVVNRPTLFPMASGAGLMGEAGPEAVMPLKRGRGGKLGVVASGGGGDVYVSVHNHTDATVSTRKSQGPGGQMQVDILVEQVEGRIADRTARGQGSLGKVMEGRYGLQPVGR